MAQLQNKLLWTGEDSEHAAFQSVGDVVSIDPTYGLNGDDVTTTGAYRTASTKISTVN